MTTAITFPGGPVPPAAFDQDTPGVEIIQPSDHNEAVGLACRRLIGVLHRRLRPKFVGLQVTDTQTGSSTETSGQTEAVDSLVDLSTFDGADWDSRALLYSSLGREASSAEGERFAVIIRGWDEVESAVLVDGQPVKAAIIDLAIAAVAFVEPLRAGNGDVLTIVRPPSLDAAQEELWIALFQLCEDRLGIDRGVLTTSSSVPATRSPISAVA